jgi:hypothetical protein
MPDAGATMPGRGEGRVWRRAGSRPCALDWSPWRGAAEDEMRALEGRLREREAERKRAQEPEALSTALVAHEDP